MHNLNNLKEYSVQRRKTKAKNYFLQVKIQKLKAKKNQMTGHF